MAGRVASQSGVTYLAVMIAILVLTITLAATGSLWSLERRRDNEQELLFVGAQYRAAIARYHALVWNGKQRYPERLEDLLLDRRVQATTRYLRRLYPDPMTGTLDWGLLREPGGGIMGVYSNSKGIPVKRASFPKDLDFGDVKTYSEWRFIAAASSPGGVAPGAGAAGPGSQPGAGPAASAPGAPGAPAVATSTAQAAEPQPPSLCDQLAADDESICSRQEQRFGRELADACRQSAQQRLTICVRDGVTDGLYFPHLIFRQR